MKKLENKVAIVTGAGSGLGKAITTLYCEQGAKVVAADFNEASLKNLEKEIPANGTLKVVKADMSQPGAHNIANNYFCNPARTNNIYVIAGWIGI